MARQAKQKETAVLSPMVTLRGAKGVPLLMHNGRTANPGNEFAVLMKEITGKRTKTVADYERLQRIEFEASLYFDKEVGVYLPAEMLESCIREGAKVSKNGRKIQAGCFVEDVRVPLNYSGPKTVQELFDNEAFKHQATVRVQSSRTLRTRPMFDNWSCTFTLMVLTDVLNEAEVIQAIEDAGRLKGLGDYRPRYGRFAIEDWTS